MLLSWMAKCDEDSGTSDWIAANTKVSIIANISNFIGFKISFYRSALNVRLSLKRMEDVIA